MGQQKIIPHLWFDSQAKAAADFYVSVFGKDSAVKSETYYTDEGKEIHGKDAGSVMTVDFNLFGYQFVGLNGGPIFNFNPSISFIVTCGTKEEVDKYWDELSVGGQVLMPLDSYPFSEWYGWIQDKYGVSWQIILYENAQQKIMPSLMFVNENYGKAEEAMNYYTKTFPDSEVVSVFHYGENDDQYKADAVMYADFKLFGELLAAMDSGLKHDFSFNEAISLMVVCESQEEIDSYWNKLTAYPKAEQCGWLKDQFGVSWQIVPSQLESIMKDQDEAKVQRVIKAFMQMKKLDIQKLQEAFDG
ncbi:MAG: VOC family protein [Balneolaceae bacterium]